jgi:hypothetical protein
MQEPGVCCEKLYTVVIKQEMSVEHTPSEHSSGYMNNAAIKKEVDSEITVENSGCEYVNVTPIKNELNNEHSSQGMGFETLYVTSMKEEINSGSMDAMSVKEEIMDDDDSFKKEVVDGVTMEQNGEDLTGSRFV